MSLSQSRVFTYAVIRGFMLLGVAQLLQQLPVSLALLRDSWLMPLGVAQQNLCQGKP